MRRLSGRHVCLEADSWLPNIPRNSTNTRLYLLAAILVLWCGGICLRLVYLQIFRYGSFRAAGTTIEQQRTIEVSASRGIIYDRAGHELAMSIRWIRLSPCPRDSGSGWDHFPDFPNHASRSAGNCWPSARLLRHFAGWRARRTRRSPTAFVPSISVAFTFKKSRSGFIPSESWRPR